MPVDLSLYCDNHIEWDYTTTNDVSGITINNSGISTLEYNPNNYVTIGTILDDWSPTKHFNCKRCGAPNQIDVCEYCGSAAED